MEAHNLKLLARLAVSLGAEFYTNTTFDEETGNTGKHGSQGAWIYFVSRMLSLFSLMVLVQGSDPVPVASIKNWEYCFCIGRYDILPKSIDEQKLEKWLCDSAMPKVIA
jgi:hypothetical protein